MLSPRIDKLWQESKEEHNHFRIEHIGNECLPEYRGARAMAVAVATDCQRSVLVPNRIDTEVDQIGCPQPSDNVECDGGCSQYRGKAKDRSAQIDVTAYVET